VPWFLADGNCWWPTATTSIPSLAIQTAGTLGTQLANTLYWQNAITTGSQSMTTTPLGAYQYLAVQNVIGPAIVTTSAATVPPGYAYYAPAFDIPMQVVGRPNPSPAIIHAGRRAVRRSIDLYLRLRPAEELRRFVSGHELLIEGARLRYRVRKSIRIMAHTMRPDTHGIPFQMDVLDPRDGGAIASGCVFLQRTPVLDQLLAFIMHVTDPDGERHLVRTTNWSPRLPQRVLDALEAPPLALAA